MIMQNLRSILGIILGANLTAFGIKGFLLSSHFIDGGITGIAMLLNHIFHLPIGLMVFIINFPFIIIGHKQLGFMFALKSAFAIFVLALALYFIPFPDVTPDKLLTALFGGFFIGIGIGISMRSGGVMDGTEMIALLISKKSPAIKVGDAILGINLIIFSTAVFILGVEPALYSITTYFTASKMIVFVVNGIEEYIGVTVVSNHSVAIKNLIIEKLNRGVTIYQGKSGYGKRGEGNENIDIVYTVLTRIEIGKFQNEIDRIDPRAFIVYQSINDIKGGIIKKRPLH